MRTTIMLAAVFAIALTVKTIWGGRLVRVRVLRDTNLSLNGFVRALGITVLVSAGIAISMMGAQLDGLASGAGEVVYAQADSYPADGADGAVTEGTTGMTESAVSEAPAYSPAGASEIPAPSSADAVTEVPGAVCAPASATASEYADGTYSGTANGFKGPITVAVEIVGGIISKVEVTDQQDDRRWFERAYAGVVQEIMSAQNANVDTVSGATYSSRGIIAGAAEALDQARAAVQ